jgi:hypothetical protein
MARIFAQHSRKRGDNSIKKGRAERRGKLTCHKQRVKLSCKALAASLAQLVEQRFRKAWVAGSSPATGSILNRVCGSSLEAPDWPLSVKVSVNWGVDEQFATIRQNSTETPPKLACAKATETGLAFQRIYFGARAFCIRLSYRAWFSAP